MLVKLSFSDNYTMICYSLAEDIRDIQVISTANYPTHGHADIFGKVTSLIDLSLGMDHEATCRENILLRGAMLGFSIKELKD